MRIADAIKIVKNGGIFSCKVVSYDKSRNTGGKIISIPHAKISDVNARNFPTANIQLCDGGVLTNRIITIHMDLLMEVNGERVYG